jgi:molybdopterin-guanine dinucleotide biosynthesis protein A
MGTPKALLRVGGRPILEHLLDRLAWPGPTWLITAPGRERPPGWERFHRELVDPAAGIGPLRGILTALEHPDATEIVISTVDMPAMTTDALCWLVDELHRRPDSLGLLGRRQAESHQQVEPFPLALRAGAAPVIRRRIEAGRRSVRGLIDEPGFIAVPWPSHLPQTMWLNLNEPADLPGLADLPG